ncbi:MAG TPA: TolC family protein [Verrucomicrobiae bacterium]|nr:TolC family protein [Verrucomicrobiae bacterium]
MPRYLSLVILIAAACGPVIAHAAESPLTLAEAVRLAGVQAPRLEAQDAVVAAAEAEASRAGVLPDPMLMVGIENLPVTGGDAFDPTFDDMTMKRIGVRQEFPAAAKRNAQRTLALRQVDEARAQAAVERLAVQRAAADAWIDAWAVNHEVHAFEQLREQARLAAKLARARAGGGAGSLADALAVESAGLELENQLEDARGQRDAALASLRRWVPGAGAPSLANTPVFDALPFSRSQLQARLDEIAPLLGSRARVETAAAAVDASRADKRPDWSLTAAYGQRDRDRSDMLSVEVGIALPLFQRSRQDRGVLAREAEYRQALALREDERRALAAEIDAAFVRWEALKRQVALHERRLLPLARDRSAAALAAYRAGGELQPWFDARVAELEVHRSHAEHLGELGRVWAALAFLLPENAP